MAGTLQDTVVVSAEGSEDEARTFAAFEVERIAKELDQDADPSPPGASEVFTAHISPMSMSFPPGTNFDKYRIPVNFPWADAEALAKRMRREVEYVYATHGADAVRNLPIDIERTARMQELDDGVAQFYQAWRNAVPWSSKDQQALAGRTTRLACIKSIADTLAKAEASLAVTEKRAAELAAKSLETAGKKICLEAPRYLDVQPLGRRGTAEDILAADVKESSVLLKGPSLPALVGALRSIHDRRRALTSAVDRAEKAKLSNPIAALATAEEVASAAADLALQISVEAVDFPVLHRIWRVPDLTGAQMAFHPTDREPILISAPLPDRGPGYAAAVKARASSLDAINALKHAIWSTLRNAWNSNASFAAAIAARTDRVWRYQPLIAKTLQGMGVREPSVEFRAALDRVVDESGMSVLSQLNLVIAGLSAAAWMAGAVPPVAAVLAIAGAVLGLAEAVYDFWKRLEQNAAYNAVLDPSEAVASPTGYTGVVVAIAFSVLDIKGVKDALGALRVGRGVAPTVAGLVSP